MKTLPSAAGVVAQLKLTPHPEGGCFAESFRDTERIRGDALPSRFGGRDHAFSTSIYFMLRAGEVSRLHRISSAELWFFHLGAPLTVVELLSSGELIKTVLGGDVLAGQRLQHAVPAGTWFGALHTQDEGSLASDAYSLVSCTVAPGFEFADFELAQPGSPGVGRPVDAEQAALLDRLLNKSSSHA